MPPIEDVEWEDCFLEPHRDPELERGIRRANGGFLPAGTLYFTPCPWLARAIPSFNTPRGELAHIEPELALKVGLVVSQDNSCRYCFAEHRVLMRFTGVAETLIRRLEQDLLTAELEPRERAAIEFGRRLSRANPVITEQDLQPLRAAGFGDPAIREIAVVAALMVAANRVTTIPAIPPHAVESLPDRWYLRPAIPLLGPLLKRRWHPGPATFLQPEEKAGPFAGMLTALDGLPLARVLRRVFDEAWISPLLPTRTKALVFAVVARGLGCEASEREAARLADREGIEAELLAQVLAHLSAPGLDELEALAVLFARETLWYRPAPLQRHARAVHKKLGSAAFLELAGVASFANLLGRLGAAAPAR